MDLSSESDGYQAQYHRGQKVAYEQKLERVTGYQPFGSDEDLADH